MHAHRIPSNAHMRCSKQSLAHHRVFVSSHAAQVPSRSRHAARAAPSAPGASRAELESLLARKEAQLASMFEGGRAMPKAAEVAKLRSEVAALADQLAGRPVQPLVTPGSYGTPSTPSTFGQPGTYGPPSGTGNHNPGVPLGAIGSVAPSSIPRSRTEELAYKAYDMVEQQMRTNQGPANTEDAEIARLEVENTQLRAQAFDLLKRQQELETLLAEVRGSKPPDMLLNQTEGILARMRAKLQRQ